MADQRLRLLERLVSGDSSREVALLRQRLRQGTLDVEDARRAAALGHAPARAALGHDAPATLEGLGPTCTLVGDWGVTAAARVLVSAFRACLPHFQVDDEQKRDLLPHFRLTLRRLRALSRGEPVGDGLEPPPGFEEHFGLSGWELNVAMLSVIAARLEDSTSSHDLWYLLVHMLHSIKEVVLLAPAEPSLIDCVRSLLPTEAPLPLRLPGQFGRWRRQVVDRDPGLALTLLFELARTTCAERPREDDDASLAALNAASALLPGVTPARRKAARQAADAAREAAPPTKEPCCFSVPDDDVAYAIAAGLADASCGDLTAPLALSAALDTLQERETEREACRVVQRALVPHLLGAVPPQAKLPATATR